MVDTVTFGNVTTSSAALANASGYNQPTVTSDGKTLPHWLAVLWSAVLVVDERVAATGAALAATSESEVTVGTGERVFAIGTGKGFEPGLWVFAARTSAPATTYMIGQVTGYAEGVLSLEVPEGGTAGSGTHTDWTIGISGRRGPQGVPGELTEEGADLIYVRLDQQGAANGVATLDGAGKVPASQLTLTAIEYKGGWNAATNTPSLADGVGSTGDLYRVSVAGDTELDGEDDWEVGDSAVFNGTTWEKWDHTSIAALVEDLAPKLGGDLDTNGFGIDGPVPKARAGYRVVTDATGATTASDINGIIVMDRATAQTLTLHDGAPNGAMIRIVRWGEGAVTIEADTDTLHDPDGASIEDRRRSAIATRIGGTWQIEGGLTS